MLTLSIIFLIIPAFKCPLELCNKTFAVRSNARRHLKTHGITLPGDGDGKDDSGKDEYHVGFEEPVVIDVHEFGDGDYSTNEGDGAGTGGRGQRGRPKQRRELRWVPPSLAGRTNAAKLRSLSPASDMADVDAPDGEDGEDEDDEDPSHPSTKSSTRGRNTRHPSAVDLTFSQRRRPGLQVAPTPLSPVKPTDPAACADLDVKYEERDSYAEMGVYPYHPQQVSRRFKAIREFDPVSPILMMCIPVFLNRVFLVVDVRVVDPAGFLPRICLLSLSATILPSLTNCE